VIGLGYFGSRHARVYADHPGAKVVAVADIDGARVAELAALTRATGCGSFRELLSRPELQAVSICLPDRLHEEAAIAAAEAGKAILLEKPLAHDASAARRIVEAVERNGVRLMVGHILRFDSRYVQVHEAAEAAADPPVDLGPEVRVAPDRSRIVREIKTLVGDVERGGRPRSDNLEGRAEAVHQPVGPRPGIVQAADGTVLELQHRVKDVLVAGAEHLALPRVDPGDAGPADPLHGVDVMHAHVEEDRACGPEPPRRRADAVALRADVDGLAEPRRIADELDHFLKATLSGAPYLQHYREAYDAIPVLDALAESARSGKPVDVRR
jgi:UDP-N-acetylglucosamine 3-dehydrogenase